MNSTKAKISNQKYWDNFYKDFQIENNSTFCDYIKTKVKNDMFIIDLGCGMGQDTWSFYRDNYTVIGIDRSKIAIDRNNEKKILLGASSRIKFENIDISSKKSFSSYFEKIKETENKLQKKILVYARFLLHSVEENVENLLLEIISDNFKKGDLFAVEFRTIEDKGKGKIYNNHFRRYIDADKFINKCILKYQLEVVDYIKGTGLSVFKSEDPFLARILLQKQ